MDNKLQTIIGIGLVAIAIFGFLLSVVTQLPKDSQVQASAHPLTTVPADLFTNSTAQQIKKLTVPGNLPVQAQPKDLGRSNVFDSF